MESKQADLTKVCHACLCITDKLYQPPDFPSFIGVRQNKQLSSSLCGICATLYHKCVQFKTSAMEARNWLTAAWKDGPITEDDIRNKKHTLHVPVKLSKTENLPFYHYTNQSEIKFKTLSPVSDCEDEPILQFLDPEDDIEYDNLNTKKDNIKHFYTAVNYSCKAIQKPESKIIKDNIIRLPEGTSITIRKCKRKIDEVKQKYDEDFYLIINQSETNNEISQATSDDFNDNDFKDDEESTNEQDANKKKSIYLKDYFDIRIRTMEEQQQDLDKRKESKEYMNAPYKCYICFMEFKTEKAFETHMTPHIQVPSKFSCDICDLHWMEKEAYYRHRDTHMFLLTCKQCKFTTKNKNEARTHIFEIHSGKKYKCEKCDDVFESKDLLKSHTMKVHPDDNICILCGYSYMGLAGINRHKQSAHPNHDFTIPEDGPICTECDVKFANTEALNTHLRVSLKHNTYEAVEVPTRPVHCGSPPPLSRDAKDVRQLLWKTLLPPEACEQCGKLLHSRLQYRSHFSKAHPGAINTKFPPRNPKKYLCQECGKAFLYKIKLREHMAVHTGELFTCDSCVQEFRTKDTLVTHYKSIHLGIVYPCPICGRKFDRASHRDRHYTYAHISTKDVKCDFCDKSFKSEGEKKTHVDHVHFKEPYNKKGTAKKRRNRKFSYSSDSDYKFDK